MLVGSRESGWHKQKPIEPRNWRSAWVLEWYPSRLDACCMCKWAGLSCCCCCRWPSKYREFGSFATGLHLRPAIDGNLELDSDRVPSNCPSVWYHRRSVSCTCLERENQSAGSPEETRDDRQSPLALNTQDYQFPVFGLALFLSPPRTKSQERNQDTNNHASSYRDPEQTKVHASKCLD